MMPTRWILLLLKFFAGSAAVALAVAVLAPMPTLRWFGDVARWANSAALPVDFLVTPADVM